MRPSFQWTNHCQVHYFTSYSSRLATGKGTTRSISESQAELRTNGHKLCVLTNHLLLKDSLTLLREIIRGKECVLSSKKYNLLICPHQWQENYKIIYNYPPKGR